MQPTQSAPVEVEVDVLSGRPNPTFTLDDPGELTQVLLTLSEGDAPRGSAAPALGFRGFVVRGLDLSRFGDHDLLRVLGDTVVASKRDDGEVVLQDRARSIYTMLRTASERHVPAGVFEAIPEDGL